MPHYRILARIRERPLFGGRRILWISRAEQCPELDPADLLEKNRKTVTTVVLEGAEKGLSSWSKVLPVFSLAHPTKPADREGWLHFLATQNGLSLDRSAIVPLLTTFEGSMGPVDRLFRDLSAENLRKVTAKDLERHGVIDHYKTVFDLIRGLEGAESKFFREWERFLENGQSPFGLLSLLHRQWKLYRIAQNALGEGGDPKDAERAVCTLGGVPPFVAAAVVRFSGKLSPESLRRGTQALWEADALLKSGISTELVMDQLAATLFSLSRLGKEGKRQEWSSRSRRSPQKT